MRPVRFLHKIGDRRHSIRHKRLFVSIVLRLIAHQDPVLGRSRVYIIQLSSVSDGGNPAGRQCAHPLLLLRGSHGERSESGLQEQRFFRGRSTGRNCRALAGHDEAHQQHREDEVHKGNHSSHSVSLLCSSAGFSLFSYASSRNLEPRQSLHGKARTRSPARHQDEASRGACAAAAAFAAAALAAASAAAFFLASAAAAASARFLSTASASIG